MCVIVNEAGGTVRRTGADQLRDRVAGAFAGHGMKAVLVFAPGEGLAQEARAALEASGSARFDVVVVGGGDGTVSAVAGVLVGTETPLGVLPLGTLNHFAKDLGLPLEIEDAVAAMAAGRARPVDVAEVNGRIFINNSSVGVYPYMVADRDRQRHVSGRGKWLAMAAAAWRALWRFPVRRLTIVAEDGWARPYRTPCVFVGNNAYEINFFEFGARAALDAGELCLYVVKDRGRWGLLWLGLRAALGRLDQARDFDMRCGLTSAEIKSRASRLRVSIDGEIAMMRPPLRYRIRPGALRVLVPSQSARR